METFFRLAMALSVYSDVNIEPLFLWEKVDAIMTDSVTKNLGTEETISNALGSTHQPYHLLCKSHTVEALDKSNLEVLAKIEKSVKQQEVFKQINQSLLKIVFPWKESIG